MTAIVLIGCALMLAYQAYVTVLVARAAAYDRRQKRLQYLLVWGVPIIGAALAHWFATHGVEPLPASDRTHVAQPPNHYGR